MDIEKRTKVSGWVYQAMRVIFVLSTLRYTMLGWDVVQPQLDSAGSGAHMFIVVSAADEVIVLSLATLGLFLRSPASFWFTGFFAFTVGLKLVAAFWGSGLWFIVALAVHIAILSALAGLFYYLIKRSEIRAT